jgi:hypothetical protein
MTSVLWIRRDLRPELRSMAYDEPDDVVDQGEERAESLRRYDAARR